MAHTTRYELEHYKKRLKYFTRKKEEHLNLKAESSSSPGSPYDKWVDIYSERVQSLEKNINSQKSGEIKIT